MNEISKVGGDFYDPVNKIDGKLMPQDVFSGELAEMKRIVAEVENAPRLQEKFGI